MIRIFKKTSRNNTQCFKISVIYSSIYPWWFRWYTLFKNKNISTQDFGHIAENNAFPDTILPSEQPLLIYTMQYHPLVSSEIITATQMLKLKIALSCWEYLCNILCAVTGSFYLAQSCVSSIYTNYRGVVQWHQKSENTAQHSTGKQFTAFTDI